MSFSPEPAWIAWMLFIFIALAIASFIAGRLSVKGPRRVVIEFPKRVRSLRKGVS